MEEKDKIPYLPHLIMGQTESAQEMTGLIPALKNSEQAADNYSEIWQNFPFAGQEKALIKQRKGKNKNDSSTDKGKSVF